MTKDEQEILKLEQERCMKLEEEINNMNKEWSDDLNKNNIFIDKIKSDNKILTEALVNLVSDARYLKHRKCQYYAIRDFCDLIVQKASEAINKCEL